MVNIGSFLFGKEPKAQTFTGPNISAQQQQLLNALIAQLMGTGEAGGLVGQFGQEEGAYPGELTAPMSRLEGTSLAALEQSAMNAVSGPTATAAKGAVEREAKGEVDLTGFEDMFKKSIQDPTVKSFREETIPEIGRRFAGNAAFGSDRQMFEQNVLEDLGKTLTGTKADMLFKTQEAAKERSLRAAGLAPEILTGEMGILSQLLQAGGVPRQIEQAKLTNEYQEFLRRRGRSEDMFNKAIALALGKTVDNQTVGLPGFEGAVQGFIRAFGGGMGQSMGGGNFLR